MARKEAASDVLQDILRVRADLGRFPSEGEYRQHGRFSRDVIDLHFGSWSKMLLASGFQYAVKGRRDKQELRKRAHEHLVQEVEEKRVARPPPITHRLLCISDMHHPYGHPDTVPFLLALKGKYKFDRILVGGDEIDGHALSFHDHDSDLLSAGHELEAAIKCLEPLYKAFPQADVLESNHGSLVYRKGKHHGLPRQVLKSYGEILRSPADWVWHHELVLQFSNGKKAVAHHGYSSNVLSASRERGMSLIQFHFHNSLSIQFWENADDAYFALQSGCLIDDKSLAYAYNKLSIKRPIIGCSGVLEGVPVLFPMFLDRHKRWTGRIP